MPYVFWEDEETTYGFVDLREEPALEATQQREPAGRLHWLDLM